MPKITPFLWFDRNAEEAVNHYMSIFKDSKIISKSYYTEAGPLPKGTVLVIHFTIDGNELMALNGGPEFKFNEAISLYINCETQAEIDTFWDKLSQGGEQGPCGWLKDKFGVSWQVAPIVMSRYLVDKDPTKVNRVMEAMMKMKKIDIAGLERAYAGKA